MEKNSGPAPKFERDPFPKMIIIVAIISLTLFTFVAAVLLTDLANRQEERFVPPVGDDAFDIPEIPDQRAPAAVPLNPAEEPSEAPVPEPNSEAS
jgi:hypothetical protein